MSNIALLIRIEDDLEAVYRRVATLEGIAAWFTEATSDDYAPGGRLTLHFPGGSTAFEVATMTPDSEVAWRCTSEGSDWAGTTIRFTFERRDPKTLVRFDHSGWPEVTDAYRDCAMSWAYFLESLKLLAETGSGTPEGVAPPCDQA